MRALLDLNILWKSKYFEFFHIEHQLYVQVAEDWLAQRYAGMNQYERLMFWLYRKQNKDMNLGQTPFDNTQPESAQMYKS